MQLRISPDGDSDFNTPVYHALILAPILVYKRLVSPSAARIPTENTPENRIFTPRSVAQHT
jgi:hypothetical protein